MKNKFILHIVIFLILFCFSLAGENVKIKKLIKEFNQKYKTIKSLVTELVIETANEEGKQTRAFCQYYYLYPNNFYKKLKNENSESITISDGKKIRVIFTGAGIEDDFKIDELDTGILNKIYLQNLIVNYIDVNKLFKIFNVDNLSENDNFYILDLNPVEDNGIVSIRLNLDKKTLLPFFLIIHYLDISGKNKSIIFFDDIKINSEIDKKFFNLNKK